MTSVSTATLPWGDVWGQDEALRQLQAAVVGSLEAACVVPPRAADFRPHVTVQRDLRRLPDAIALPPLRWAVDGFALLRSEAGRGYACVASWPLA